MQIVQISTSDIHGGAARACYRLHCGLTLIGQYSSMLVQSKSSADPNVFQIQPEKAAKKYLQQLRWIQKYLINLHRTEISSSYFSLSEPGFNLSAHPQILSADIVNLHWVTGLVSPPALARLQALGKPIFWTLHDQRPFTGGCHYSAGCHHYESACHQCPQLCDDKWDVAGVGFKESMDSVRAEELVVISPSEWLASCARHSALLGKARIEVIPNGIDPDIFKPQPKAEVRRLLGLAGEGIYFLFGSDSFDDKRKGLRELLEALRICLVNGAFREQCAKKQVQFLYFGDPRHDWDDLPIAIHSYGRIDSELELARLYAAADAFLLPSLEDNLPNTLLEAMCCGTPAIGFEIGGVPDVITSQETGVLVPAGDCLKFAEAIKAFAQNAAQRKRMSENCSHSIPQRFSLQIQAQRYFDLYQKQLTARPPCNWTPKPIHQSPVLAPGPALGAIFAPLLRQAQEERRARPWKSLTGLFKKK